MTDRARITVFDTTLRDGEQAPGFSMNTGEKLRLARQLEQLHTAGPQLRRDARGGSPQRRHQRPALSTAVDAAAR